MSHLGALTPLALHLAATKKSSGASSLIFLLLLVVLLVFVVMRPQRRRAQQMQQTQSQLRPGVEVQTTAGLFAKVVSVDGDVVTLEVAPGVHSRYMTKAVVRVVTPAEDQPSTADDAATATSTADGEAPSEVGSTDRSGA